MPTPLREQTYHELRKLAAQGNQQAMDILREIDRNANTYRFTGHTTNYWDVANLNPFGLIVKGIAMFLGLFTKRKTHEYDSQYQRKTIDYSNKTSNTHQNKGHGQ